MGLKYYRLWDLLNRKGMKKTDLLAITNSTTLARLGKNEDVSTKTIEKICEFLNCQPEDIMEYTKE